ncbi:aquaporin-like protein [Dacryopinax primogenitus]|uniref:Aquaporin-like protein n=1 Tax=Dacryopinax primogenitus (strain DJM 731) TaxID=1858805 RepID=M5FTH9_DACPD|nr:aquaporin-like protein [Dacryopinax primogenitus]EJT99388.1 aquaporin-like protein [Dacryopinax primogenitus]
MSRDIRHDVVFLNDLAPVPSHVTRWERIRYRDAHLLVQCLAEAMGTFLYCFCGIGSQAANTTGNINKLAGLGSVLQIGFAYAVGIMLALLIAGPTSGGHFNPCVTIANIVFRGFPLRKAPFYIVAQILGAFVACLVVYLQYRDVILQMEAGLAAAGELDAINFTAQGPAGIFGLYVTPGTNLGIVFWNEFSCDFILGLAIWACIDPTNFFAPPAMAPMIISVTYATIIWGFSPIGLAANSARDVGARIMVLCIWGTKAAGGPYAAIAALANIPATLLAAAFYEYVFRDCDRVVPSAQREYFGAMDSYAKRKEEGPTSFVSSDPELPIVASSEVKG